MNLAHGVCPFRHDDYSKFLYRDPKGTSNISQFWFEVQNNDISLRFIKASIYLDSESWILVSDRRK